MSTKENCARILSCLTIPVIVAVTARAAAADLSVHSALTKQNGYPRTTTGTTALDGVAEPAATASVLVAGVPASWNVAAGTWTATGVALFPGINTAGRRSIGRRSTSGTTTAT